MAHVQPARRTGSAWAKLLAPVATVAVAAAVVSPATRQVQEEAAQARRANNLSGLILVAIVNKQSDQSADAEWLPDTPLRDLGAYLPAAHAEPARLDLAAAGESPERPSILLPAPAGAGPMPEEWSARSCSRLRIPTLPTVPDVPELVPTGTSSSVAHAPVLIPTRTPSVAAIAD